MTQGTLTVGAVVTHRQRAEWGLGKILELDSPKAWVYFKDIAGKPKDAVKVISGDFLVLAPVQSDPVLDNLPPLVHNGRIVDPGAFRLTLQQAIDMFVKRFGSFEDAEYLERERNYKWDAHRQIRKELASLSSARADDVADTLRGWIHLTNLLARQDGSERCVQEPGRSQSIWTCSRIVRGRSQ